MKYVNNVIGKKLFNSYILPTSYVARPTNRHKNSERILIENVGTTKI